MSSDQDHKFDSPDPLAGRGGRLARGSDCVPALTADGAEPEQLLASVCSVLGEMRRRDYYEVLGVRQGSSAGDIELAYRGLVAGWAPERFVRERPAIRDAAAEIATLVDSAYRALEARAVAAQPASMDSLFDDVESAPARVPPPVIDFGEEAEAPERARRESAGGGVSVQTGGRWSAVKKLFRRG